MPENAVKQKSYSFAIKIIKAASLLKQHRHPEISSQLLRSGTSIGANVEEALAAQSRKDFFNKMSIASKEAREANYWLRLIRDTDMQNSELIMSLLQESFEIIKILTSIVKTGNMAKEFKIK